MFFTSGSIVVALALFLPHASCGEASDVDAYMAPSLEAQNEAPAPKIHIGCYKEKTRGDSLKTFAGVTNAAMSLQVCETHCSQYQATMYGLTRGNQCLCGDQISTGTVGAPLKTLLTEPKVPSTIVHKGCYKEPAGAKSALSDYPLLNDAKMTIKMCQYHCSAYQSKFFGVENGRICNCGDDFKAATAVANSICKTACGGDKGSFCGANNHFNLYELDFKQFTRIGQWGPLIQFPVVPVAVALLPESGNLLAWSAGWKNDWTFAGNGKTYYATYDTKTKNVTQGLYEDTKHDMFCPGLSMTAEGKVFVNGGSTYQKASQYDEQTSRWTGISNMNVGRAYHSSTSTSEGKVFAIGGNWRGAGKKDGEVYDPKSNTWTSLPGAPVSPMIVAAHRGGIFQDSHTWLFAWKNAFVFQAGPSKAMNWYGTKGTGSHKAAGLRGADTDSMCGIFVMFDALAGKILTLGGATTYTGTPHKRAHIITLGESNSAVNVQRIGDAEYARGYANSVVLPDGKVFIVGGQYNMVLFSDSNPVLFPEMFDPETNTFSKLRAHTVPRNYHSVAILMPDATVFVGSGGLCGGCQANHFDGQHYSPPYLFEDDGVTLAKRPSISSADSKVVLGGSIAITMAETGSYTFSLIRMSAVTHATNTDQRRIPLTAFGSGTDYAVTIPSDAGIALPGYWMLFANNENGVPSVAHTVQVLI
ncbi:galactose oxidase [Rhexocercosporidium sp. MPI-PUGE-AT-0058]|nr:galactose oxidase [Rhexocercosporidium sp. MPI-PUGE-AT-0058]